MIPKPFSNVFPILATKSQRATGKKAKKKEERDVEKDAEKTLSFVIALRRALLSRSPPFRAWSTMIPRRSNELPPTYVSFFFFVVSSNFQILRTYFSFVVVIFYFQFAGSMLPPPENSPAFQNYPCFFFRAGFPRAFTRQQESSFSPDQPRDRAAAVAFFQYHRSQNWYMTR